MKIVALIAITLLSPTLLPADVPKPTPPVAMIPPFRDDWKLLEVKSKDSKELWLFRKNIGVSEIKGRKEFPTLVYFTVAFRPRDESGLPNAQDLKSLYDFEENVIPKVEKETTAVMVASVVKAGIKDHLFYVSNADAFIKCMNKHRKSLESFRVSFEKHEDPEWAIYEDFPDGD